MIHGLTSQCKQESSQCSSVTESARLHPNQCSPLQQRLDDTSCTLHTEWMCPKPAPGLSSSCYQGRLDGETWTKKEGLVGVELHQDNWDWLCVKYPAQYVQTWSPVHYNTSPFKTLYIGQCQNGSTANMSQNLGVSLGLEDLCEALNQFTSVYHYIK